MPEPITAPMPSAVSDQGPRDFFNECSGSSESRISLSIDLRASSWLGRAVLLIPTIPGHCQLRASAGGGSDPVEEPSPQCTGWGPALECSGFGFGSGWPTEATEEGLNRMENATGRPLTGRPRDFGV